MDINVGYQWDMTATDIWLLDAISGLSNTSLLCTHTST